MLPPGNGDADLVLLHRRRVLQQPADLNPWQIPRFGCNGIVQIDGSSEFQPGVYDYLSRKALNAGALAAAEGSTSTRALVGVLTIFPSFWRVYDS